MAWAKSITSHSDDETRATYARRQPGKEDSLVQSVITDKLMHHDVLYIYIYYTTTSGVCIRLVE
jgi:hypothetical protein